MGGSTNKWSDPLNWSNGVPGNPTNATIMGGQVTIDQPAFANSITISSTASVTCNTMLQTANLTLKSDASGTASFISFGPLPIIATVESYMTANKWHILTPPVAPLNPINNINAFLQNSTNEIAVNGSNYGMMDYNEKGNNWNNYFTASTTDPFILGKGYCVRRKTDGVITFTGPLNSGIMQSIQLTKTGAGWNCIGNPYPSVIDISTFLSTNVTSLEASYACVYLWDEQPDYSGNRCDYKIIGNAPIGFMENYIAPGQGFFVKAASNTATVQFSPVMQMHQNFIQPKSTKVLWPSIRLNIASGDNKASTIVAFNSTMTKGLDPTFDAGLLRGTSGLSLYSHLVNDNGTDFAVQCLPEKYDSLVIPIGVDSKNSDEITFSAETLELPANCSVILEDKSTGTFTSLTGSETYKATIAAGTSGTGRFFLHTSSTTTNNNTTTKLVNETAEETVKAYAVRKTIYLNGKLNGTTAQLYDLNGKCLSTHKLTSDNTVTLDKSNLTNGVYILHVTTEGKIYSFKVILIE